MEGFLAAAILFFAALVHGLVGFAFALLAVPLLSFLWPLKSIVPLMALLGAVLNGLLFLSLRRHFEPRRVLSLFLGAIPGVVVGVFFLNRAPEGILRTVLGLTLIIYGFWGLLHPRPKMILGEKWGERPPHYPGGPEFPKISPSGPPRAIPGTPLLQPPEP